MLADRAVSVARQKSKVSEAQISAHPRMQKTGSIARTPGLKNKDLMGVPWRVAFALQDAGWHLRQDIIWHKPNPMPESTRDRCTKAHEYLFLLTRSPRYWWDRKAMQEPAAGHPGQRQKMPDGWDTGAGAHGNYHRSGREKGRTHPIGIRAGQDNGQSVRVLLETATRNRRSVWTIATEPSDLPHYAMFPRALVRPCIAAGCPPGGVVLDPFAWLATTGLVALELDRSFIGLELNPEYCALSRERLENELPMFGAEITQGGTAE